MKSPEFLAKSPAGQIPVLEFSNGVCITQFFAIYRTLARANPKTELFGSNNAEATMVDAWLDVVETDLKFSCYPIKRSILGKDLKERGKMGEERYAKMLGQSEGAFL